MWKLSDLVMKSSQKRDEKFSYKGELTPEQYEAFKFLVENHAGRAVKGEADGEHTPVLASCDMRRDDGRTE